MIDFTPDRDESKFQQLLALAQELKMIVPQAFVQVQVFDRDNHLIYDVKQRSRSWTRNAYNYVLSQVGGKDLDNTTFGVGLMSLKNTAGVVKYGALPAVLGVRGSASSYTHIGTADAYNASFGTLLAAAADSTRGIQLGTGTLAESFEDYALTLIANGTGAGQMSYVQSETPLYTYDAGSKTGQVAHSRYFNNNSPGAITVGECGLTAFMAGPDTGYAVNYILLSRDKLSVAAVVPVAGQVKVTYIISLIYPS